MRQLQYYSILFITLLPYTSHAQNVGGGPGSVIDVCWGGIPCIAPLPLFARLHDVFFLAAGAIAVTIFLVGAFMMVISTGNDSILQNAKRAMKGSLIGAALVAGSYALYRIVIFLLYP